MIITMKSKLLNKKGIIVLALIFVNMIGFFGADIYFSAQSTDNGISQQWIQWLQNPSVKINSTKLFEMGMELLRNIK